VIFPWPDSKKIKPEKTADWIDIAISTISTPAIPMTKARAIFADKTDKRPASLPFQTDPELRIVSKHYTRLKAVSGIMKRLSKSCSAAVMVGPAPPDRKLRIVGPD
jgi:hypothetical protein